MFHHEGASDSLKSLEKLENRMSYCYFQARVAMLDSHQS